MVVQMWCHFIYQHLTKKTVLPLSIQRDQRSEESSTKLTQL
jgi:hypothetical protein